MNNYLQQNLGPECRRQTQPKLEMPKEWDRNLALMQWWDYPFIKEKPKSSELSIKMTSHNTEEIFPITFEKPF